MNRIKCFFIEPSGKAKIYARRYKSSTEEKCVASGMGYHDARLFSHVVIEERTDRDTVVAYDELPIGSIYPTHCSCGYEFTDADKIQSFHETIYICKETEEEMSLEKAQPGAMWDASWYPETWKVDGQSLLVRTPGGDWWIDGQAENCTLPEDKHHKHHCWIRHGVAPNITVDKNGETCGAGAGSIICGNYHGFLRNGYLEEC